jgi:hypothetical protein
MQGINLDKHQEMQVTCISIILISYLIRKNAEIPVVFFTTYLSNHITVFFRSAYFVQNIYVIPCASIKKDVTGWESSMYGRTEKCVENFVWETSREEVI